MASIVTPNRFFNVMDRYGAKGNDSADDTTKIQAAFDEYDSASGVPVSSAAWASGVYFPRARARYLITSPIQIKAGQRAWAESVGSAIINYQGSGAETGAFRIVGDSNTYAQHICFERLSIYTAAGSGIYIGADTDFGMVMRDNGGSWSDQTTAAAAMHDATFACLSSVSDWMYVRHSAVFLFVAAIFSTLCHGASWVAEYWNGSAWTSLTLTLTDSLGGRDIQLYWNNPGNWATTTATAITGGAITDGTAGYWLRFRRGTAGADATQQCYVVHRGGVQPLTLTVRDCIFDTKETSIQLGKAYIQDAQITHNNWRNGGSDLIFLRGNHNNVSHNSRETTFRGSGAQHAAFIRVIGNNNTVDRNRIEGGGLITPYHLSGVRGSLNFEWSELPGGYANSTAVILDLADDKEIEQLTAASIAKCEINFSRNVVVNKLSGDYDTRATELGIVLRSSGDPNTLVIVRNAYVKYTGEPHDSRIKIEREYSTTNAWSTDRRLAPRTGNLIKNGDFINGLGDEAGSQNITITIEAGATITRTIEDSPGGGKRLHLELTAKTGGIDKVATVTMGVGTLPTYLAGKTGRLSFNALTSPALSSDRPVILCSDQQSGNGFCRAGNGGQTIVPYSVTSAETIPWRWYVGSAATTGHFYLENVSLTIGYDDAAPCTFQQIRTPAGNGIFWGTAPPTTGDYKRGDLMINTSPSASGAALWHCTADSSAGNGGTWKAGANIAA